MHSQAPPSATDHALLDSRARELLGRWARFARSRYHDQGDGLGFYGSGFHGWAAQANQCFIGAALTLADRDPGMRLADELGQLGERALAFELETHRTGNRDRPNATRWGHTWISVLGTERMMYTLLRRWDRFDDTTRRGLERVIRSEADWLAYRYEKQGHRGIVGERWNGPANVPESNLWNGAFLWRAALLLSDSPHAEVWREAALRFLVNAVSTADDAHDTSVLDGARVCDRFAGDNFFPSLALDHHGYLNVGYMVICVSNAAMLALDLAKQGWPIPESLHRRQRELWSLIRRLTFDNARLARIGGDTRVAVAYCQDYLVPAALYAYRWLGDADALRLIHRQLDLYDADAGALETRGFFGSRLSELRAMNPYYADRLESDRAASLGMLIEHLPTALAGECTPQAAAVATVAAEGQWYAPRHGAVVHRSGRRLAAFAWRSAERAQGTCLPPGAGDAAHWSYNLAGRVDPLHHPKPTFLGSEPKRPAREIDRFTIDCFTGGFATCGTVIEGVTYALAEGMTGREAVRHHIAFAALPDDATVVGLQLARTGDAAVYLHGCRGLHLGVMNDVFNQSYRRLIGPNLDRTIEAGTARCESLDVSWLRVGQSLTAMGLYGADGFTLEDSGRREPASLPSHHVFHLHWGFRAGPLCAAAKEVVLDVGWAVRCHLAGEAESASPEANHWRQLPLPEPLRGVTGRGLDGRPYTVVANFGPAPMEARIEGGDPIRFSSMTCRVLDTASGRVVT